MAVQLFEALFFCCCKTIKKELYDLAHKKREEMIFRYKTDFHRHIFFVLHKNNCHGSN